MGSNPDLPNVKMKNKSEGKRTVLGAFGRSSYSPFLIVYLRPP